MFSRETDRYVYGVVLFVLVSIASVTPIWSYDYFWHLTAGRWIIDHHMLPEFDPLAVASAHVPWINGEWLYEIILAPLYSLGGHAGVSIINALLIAGMFTLTFALATRDHDSGTALFVAAIAFAGACDRFGVRPAVMAALLVVITVGLLRSEMPIWRLATIYAGVSVVWINVHPSALLAPVLALVTML